RTAWITRHEPYSSAVRQTQSSESASPTGIQLGTTDWSGSYHVALYSHFVRNGGIDVLTITRNAPLDATMCSSVAHTRLPKNLSALIRIECVNNAGFLACHK